MKKIDNEFFGVSNDDQEFNLTAATDAYHRVLNMGDEYEFVVRSVIYDGMDRDFTLVRKSAQALIDDHVQTTIAKAQQGIAKRISKNVDPAAYGAAVVLESISKAYGKDQYTRDVRGRFSRVEQRKFNYQGAQKVNDRVVNRMTAGSKDISTKDLDPETAAKMQQAYVGLHQMLQRARQYGIPDSDVLVELTHENGDMTTHYGSDAGKAMKSAIENKNPIVQADLAVDSGLSAGGAAFDVMAPLGAAGGNIAAGVRANSMSDFSTAWNAVGNDPREPNAQAYNRIATAAGALERALPAGTPGKVRLAVAAGKWVGEHGPEAEKVMGPGARKASYRYRGIERKPDAELLNATNSAIRGMDNANQRRDFLIHGKKNAVVGGRQGAPITEDVESPIINYFSNRLPDPALLRLQTESGHVPPSEGVIIDRNGRIVTQAVGYGDDHYLPFNLKNMSKLNGGEYVRTRAVGGLTTEDVYAGLVSGARSVTVVSNSGVYTMEFDPAFRGSRRFNDKAARMVGRYGMLLDSVKSETITLQRIPSDRMAELKAQAMDRFPDESEEGEREKYFRTLQEKEKRDPQMSQVAKDAVATQVLESYAEAHATRDGRHLTWDELKAQKVREAMVQASGTYADEPADQKLARAEQARDLAEMKFADPNSALAELGLGEKYEKALARAEHEYRAAQKPLKLNSDGYYAAQRALKEQFPYYISRTEMRPKTEPGLDDKQVGYVNPRHNRPAAARVGYFDPSVDGGPGDSKVSAQETNYQNYANRRGGSAPSAAPMKAEEGSSDTKERPAALSVDPQVLKDKAMLDLLKHINEQTNVSANAVSEAARGRSVHDPDFVRSMNTDYPLVWGNTRVPSDPTERAKLEAQVQAVIRQRIFDLDPAKVNALSGQAVAPAKAVDPSTKEFVPGYLNGSIKRVAFPGSAYEGTLVDPSNYAQHYRGLVAADHHVQKLGLPDNLASITDDQIARIKDTLRQRYIDHELDKAMYNANPSYNKPKPKLNDSAAAIQITKPAQALAKVEMLHNNYKAAVERESGLRAAAAANLPNVEVNIHGPGSPVASAVAERMNETTPANAARTVVGEIEQGGVPVESVLGEGWNERSY